MKAEIGVYPKDRQLLHQILPIDTPLGIDLGICNICNFKCNYCLQSSSTEVYNASGLRKEFMSWEIFELALQQIKAFPKKIKQLSILGMGEPTLHIRLCDMIEEIRKADVAENVMVVTNGSMLNPEYNQKLVDAGLQILRISLQGLSSKKYMEISQAKINWDTFYKNIVHFSKIRGACKLKVKIADTALEPGDEEKFYQLFGDICDAVAIEHIYDAHAPKGKMYDDVPLLQTGKNKYGLDMRKIDICWHPFIRMNINTDGRPMFCCGSWFGFERNIRDVPMVEQWNGRSVNKLRADFLRHNMMKYPPCQLCSSPVYMFHPEDILDGHEEEILKRMQDKGMLGD